MDKRGKHQESITRRGLLPLLLSGLFIPYLGMGATAHVQDEMPDGDEEAEYQTLLKADGSVVRVKKQVIAKAPVVREHVSNKALLSWLKKK
jgi:hypothetical protein